MSEALLEKCWKILQKTWAKVSRPNFKSKLADEQLRKAIERSINSQTKTYRYVLPTQLVAKLADKSLDSRCIQASRGGAGSFDARSIAQEVVVKFDKENERVLGGSPEPYVSNPLRVSEVTSLYRTQQKDKKGWDDLCYVLESVEKKQSPQFTQIVFEEVLLTILKRLSEK